MNKGDSDHHMGSGYNMPGHMGSSPVNPWQGGYGNLGHGLQRVENQGQGNVLGRQRGNDRFSGWARRLLGRSARNELL